MPTKSVLPGLLLALYAAMSPGSFAAERKATTQSNNASTTLIESASQQYADGHLDQAAATLERALHIQPNNPATLHYLGVLRLQQGQYQQAEALAARSNIRVGNNIALRNRNLQLIQAAQTAQGSNSPPIADERLVAVQEGLEEEVKRRREAEVAQERLQMASVNPEPAHEVEIPRGHWPPPGKCRIWFPDRPPGHQPAPRKCKKLRDRVPFGAYLIQG
ncbi:tetratricopeptide repeat protein [Pseudomonas fluorescens]|jgi:tetratricopeptide (TPR) repeat protein|uniref:tetratricopeptide repeat protein n=1 Tax=Pseudomonas TaxID=286 RepID=UPI0010F60075|nr:MULTISPECIES: tetratricopeptide repeat protein [Pseudomonas]MDZ5431699.1 tetratricopeptide repeat protein [Pseudomonas fluorescens]